MNYQNRESIWAIPIYHFQSKLRWTSKITVRVGSGNNGDGGSIIDVKRIIIHESYKRLYVVDYDFALLELKEPLEFDESVKPITLPVEQIKDEVRCLVTGWGRTQSEDYLSPSKLQGVELPVVNEKVCKQKYKKHPIIDFSPYITERVMCAGGEDPIKSGKLMTFSFILNFFIRWIKLKIESLRMSRW